MELRKKPLIIFITYGLIYFLTYMFYLYQRGAVLTQENLDLIGFIFIAWAISSLLSRKFNTKSNTDFRELLITHFESFLMLLGLITVILYLFDYSGVPRFLLFNTVITAAVIELVVNSIQYLKDFSISFSSFPKFSIRIFLVQLIIFFSVMLYLFFGLNTDYAGKFDYYVFVIAFMFIWIFISIISHNFNREPQKNFWYFIWPYLREYLLLGAVLVFLIFAFRLNLDFFYSYFSGLTIYAGWSFAVLYVLYPKEKTEVVDYSKFRLMRAPTLLDFKIEQFVHKDEGSFHTSETNGNAEDELIVKLEKVYLSKFPDILNFLKNNIDLNSIKLIRSTVIRSRDPYNIESLQDDSLKFFLNLHEINDVRRINQYFIEVNRVLKGEGYFIGILEPIVLRYNRIIKSYPFYLARIFYMLDFIWRRVIPKLPLVQKIYFIFTDGKNRAISLAEGLGRLYFCGFELVNAEVIDDKVVFIAKKNRIPRADQNPSYGPFFKMKRIGEGGKTIYVFKARTMHPYAEYLQEYIYNLGNLAEGGKFKGDFRITSWGKIFRKLWIDELPMIINWFKGDLKLLGVRPLSSHYLSLYTEELRQQRLKHKPGLVPPYYADMPKTLSEIMASEQRYLDAYEKNPIKTDIKYFFKAAYNIIIKKARSA